MVRKEPEKKKDDHQERRNNRTGEDIDMLHERQSDPESDENSGTYHYRDNYDGA